MLEILPRGNALLQTDQTHASSRKGGLGELSCLSDELLAYVFALLDGPSLGRCDAVSSWFSALSRQERLWKEILLQESDGKLEDWKGSWRATFIAKKQGFEKELQLPKARRIYSDVLYQSRLCSSFDSNSLDIQENIERIDARTLSTCADLPLCPVILTNAIEDWKAMKGETQWTLSNLAERCPSGKFRAESILAPLSVYAKYCNNSQHEDNPTYLFDADFCSKAKLDSVDLEAEFRVPRVFDEDLFNVMGKGRPEYRWLIAGPPNSGSTFHKDPNRTSAWNAVCSGSKLWLCLPPDTPPPGVIVSADEGEVTTPDSVPEWLLHYYKPTKALYGPNSKDARKRNTLLEGICRTGETFYVPSGWWHLVINLEEAVAVTQNYVSRRELPAVLKFMQQHPDQVSGFRVNLDDDTQETQAGIYEKFHAALSKEHPKMLADALEVVAKSEKPAQQKETLWNRIGGELEQGDSGGFSFGFEI